MVGTPTRWVLCLCGNLSLYTSRFLLLLILAYMPYPKSINYISEFLKLKIAIGVALPKTRVWTVKRNYAIMSTMCSIAYLFYSNRLVR